MTSRASYLVISLLSLALVGALAFCVHVYTSTQKASSCRFDTSNQIYWSAYTNSEFGFQIEYPNGLTPKFSSSEARVDFGNIFSCESFTIFIGTPVPSQLATLENPKATLIIVGGNKARIESSGKSSVVEFARGKDWFSFNFDNFSPIDRDRILSSFSSLSSK